MPRLRESAFLLYEVTVEALHLTLRAHEEGRASIEEVHEHRARLARLDSLLGQLGWAPGGAAGPVEITADAKYAGRRARRPATKRKPPRWLDHLARPWPEVSRAQR